jgi:AcrR family transcriptional regulator
MSPARRRLLDAAADAFAEHGFGATTTREIAARAGRSPSAVYIHHQSKEDLLYAVSVFAHDDAMACLRGAYDSADDPARRLWQMVCSFSEWHMANSALGRVVHYELQALTPEHRSAVNAMRRDFKEILVDVLAAGERAGEFDILDADATARALLSMCIDFVRWFDPTRGGEKASEVARLHADLALRMVAHPDGAPQ